MLASRISVISAILFMLLIPSLNAKTVHGRENIILQSVVGYSPDGSEQSQFTPICKIKYKDTLSQVANLNYHINPESLQEIMNISVFGQSNIRLNSAGVAGTYDFINGTLPKTGIFKNIHNIYVTVSKDFKTKEVKILFDGDKHYNCILTGKTVS